MKTIASWRPRVLVGAVAVALGFASAHCGGGDDTSTGTGGASTGPTMDGPTTASGNPTSTGPTMSSTSTTASGMGGGGGSAPDAGASVLQYHKNASRDGVTVDAAFTMANAAKMHLDAGFMATVDGQVYAQPLFVDGGNGGKDMIIVVTEKNQVYALDAATGAQLWNTKVDQEVGKNDLDCGNIDPYGITGTPVIDFASRTMFFDAVAKPNGNANHFIYAMGIDDGKVKSGWPVDVIASVKTANADFDAKTQGERGALAIMGDTVYVPYGGMAGDCLPYYGWVVGVKMNDPTKVTSWATDAQGGGVWAVGGIANDGSKLFAATGNTFNANNWGGGEALVAFSPGPMFSNAATDYWAPNNWKSLDNGDTDIGGSGPVLFDVPGATPSKVAVALGKDGNVYLMDRANLGGIADALDQVHAANNQIIGGATAYTSDMGTFVALKGNCTMGGGNLVGLKVGAASPPTLSLAWCADQHGSGSPMTTTTDGTHETIVWAMGAESSQRLYGFDGNTGTVVFDGGGANDKMSGVNRFSTPIAAKGRIYAAGTDAVFAFTSN